jgi:hypothetical protein
MYYTSPQEVHDSFEGPIAVTTTCEMCHGAAEPAARTRSFEYLGEEVHCLMLVSSCVICGHQWEDETYEVENEQFAEQARASVFSRMQASRETSGGARSEHRSTLRMQSRQS